MYHVAVFGGARYNGPSVPVLHSVEHEFVVEQSNEVETTETCSTTQQITNIYRILIKKKLWKVDIFE